MVKRVSKFAATPSVAKNGRSKFATALQKMGIYMSILISAPIRTGKTLFVVQEIFKQLNKGRMVYTNIVGINISGVISVSSSIDDPFDWRDLPNGSVLVWDEAHEHPAFSSEDLLKDFKIDETQYLERIDTISNDTSITTQTEKKRRIDLVERELKTATNKKKEQIRDIGRGLLLHGHFGIEIYFITQRPAKLNADCLASVTSHFVMRRKFGMDAAIIWEFGEAMTSWSKSTAEIALNKRLWRYPKHLYGFYVSSENHQVRKSFPAKYFAFAILPIALFLYGLSSATETGFFGLFGKKESVNSESLAVDNNSSTTPKLLNINESENIQNDESKRIASVFASSNTCRAYAGNGDLIPISESYCFYLSDHPALLKSASDAVRNERLQAINYTQYSMSSFDNNQSSSLSDSSVLQKSFN